LYVVITPSNVRRNVVYREVTASELAARLGTVDEPLVLDVREPDEVAEWAIPGAVNIPLGQLGSRARSLPGDREIVVVCASGGRSARATQLLAEAGWNATNLTGGMAAWGTVYDRVPIESDGARIVQVRRRGKGCLSYVVGAGGEAVVIDPSVDLDVYLDVVAEQGWRITRVFDTHLHADHLSGARELAARTGATLHLNPADAFHFDFVPLHDGDRFTLPGGVELAVAALHTPGHTEGSTIYFVGRRAVLTGDTLFVDGVGRPDLAERAEEFARNLHRSLNEKILTLPDEAIVLPAHHGDAVTVRPDRPVAASLGQLRQSLPPLGMDEGSFIAWARARTTPRPSNYQEIVKANMGRPETPLPLLKRLEIGPNRCSA
jgi:glyoxylase-like metal-dependent hydrolase (beta-lactamase superfamily II)/rhodanese-related sulfurtransferase